MRSRKNNIVPMRLARRILPFAACVVIVVAGLAVPQIRQKIPQKPQKPGEEKPAVEGVYAPQEVASAETEAVDERTDQTIRRHGNRGCDGTGIDCAGVGNERGCGKGNSKEPRTV